MPLPLRFCLPALAGAMNAAILFTGFVPSALNPTEFQNVTITIALEAAADLRQQVARHEQAHPFLSRIHNESSHWYWMNALNCPAIWAAIPLDIEAQHRGEEVGVFTLSSAREMIATAVIGVLVWYFVGRSLEALLSRSERRAANRPWSADVLLTLVFFVATTLPAIMLVLPHRDRGDQGPFLGAGVAWLILACLLISFRCSQVVRWFRLRRVSAL
jgi:hypothetical protein